MVNFQNLFEKHRHNVEELGIKFNSPATKQEIECLENAVDEKLPQDFREFYSFSNGFETDDALFRVLPISEILIYKQELSSSCFYFAEYMIYSDTWKIQLHFNQYTIINDDHNSQSPIILTNTICEFFERYLTGGGLLGDNGLYVWLEEMKAKQ